MHSTSKPIAANTVKKEDQRGPKLEMRERNPKVLKGESTRDGERCKVGEKCGRGQGRRLERRKRERG